MHRQISVSAREQNANIFPKINYLAICALELKGNHGQNVKKLQKRIFAKVSIYILLYVYGERGRTGLKFKKVFVSLYVS